MNNHSDEFTGAVLKETSKPLELMGLEVPAEIKPGQVLVRLRAASICGAQLNEISGAKGSDRFLPHLLGHEGAGMVLDVGPGVKRVKAGDHVVAHWRKAGGIDADPPKYRAATDDVLMVGGGWVTTFNEMALISENRLTPIPCSIPMDIAALMGCAVTTGVGLVVNEAKIKPGESVLVIGAGGVGLSVVLGARLVGAYPIVAIDRVRGRLELAKELGATDAGDEIGFSGACGEKYDVVVECTGNPGMIAEGLDATANGGRMVLVGQPRKDDPVTFIDFRKHYFGKRIFDSQGGATVPERDIARYVRLWGAGMLPVEKLVTGRYRLKNINDALDDMREGRSIGRCLIEM